jgi:hypothetical protein
MTIANTMMLSTGLFGLRGIHLRGGVALRRRAMTRPPLQARNPGKGLLDVEQALTLVPGVAPVKEGLEGGRPPGHIGS